MHTTSDDTFSWKDIRWTVPSKKKDDIEILHGISGSLQSNEMLAIIAASGSGKSSLLDVLSLHKSSGIVTGEIVYNRNVVLDSRLLREVSSYVPQADAFHPTQTVMEAVLFQAHMRLDSTVSYEQKIITAQELITVAGLKGNENRHVGGMLPGGIRVPGLSGGEIRRLSLCCAMITKPIILFVDEPTSGLDSLAALMIMKFLRSFCDQGHIVICTIHQPRQQIWNLFDKVSVLAKGYQLFFGTSSAAENWFIHDLGLSLSPETTLVDSILDICNVDFDKSMLQEHKKTFTSIEDLESAAVQFANVYVHCPTDPITLLLDYCPNTSSPGWLFKYRILLERNAKNYIRNYGNIGARMAIVTIIAMFTGLIFFRVCAGKHNNINDLFHGLFFNVFTLCLVPFCSQASILYERQFFQAENAAKLYPVSAYYAANMTLEILLGTTTALIYGGIIYQMIGYGAVVNSLNPTGAFLGFLGLIVLSNLVANSFVIFIALSSPNQEISVLVSAGYLAISAMTGGVISYANLFRGVSFLQYFSMIKYLYQTILLFLFKDNERATLPVDGAIKFLGFNTPGSVFENILIILGFYIAFSVGGYMSLKFLYKEKR